MFIDDFLKICERFGISILPLEVKNLQKLYSVASDPDDVVNFGFEDNIRVAEEFVNYRKLSIGLGLHKDSFNYLSKVQSLNRIQNLSKLRKLYQQNENMRSKINNGEYDTLLG